MSHFALTAIGEDRPGIVSAITEPLARLGCNLEDSSSSILGGHFSVMLVLSAPGPLTAEAIEREVDRFASPLGVRVAVRPLPDPDRARAIAPTHVLSVYGADRPGIVHAVARFLADREINITELETRLIGRSSAPVYAMLLEIAFPQGADAPALERELEGLAGHLGVDLSFNPIGPEAL